MSLSEDDIKTIIDSDILPFIDKNYRRKEIMTWFNDGLLVRKNMDPPVASLLGPSSGAISTLMVMLLTKELNNRHNIFPVHSNKKTDIVNHRLSIGNKSGIPTGNASSNNISTKQLIPKKIDLDKIRNYKICILWIHIASLSSKHLKTTPVVLYAELIDYLDENVTLPILYPNKQKLQYLRDLSPTKQENVAKRFAEIFLYSGEELDKLEKLLAFKKVLSEVYMRNLELVNKAGDKLVKSTPDRLISKSETVVEKSDYVMTLNDWFGLCLASRCFRNQSEIFMTQQLSTTSFFIVFVAQLHCYLYNDRYLPGIGDSPIPKKPEIKELLITIIADLEENKRLFELKSYEKFAHQELHRYVNSA